MLSDVICSAFAYLVTSPYLKHENSTIILGKCHFFILLFTNYLIISPILHVCTNEFLMCSNFMCVLYIHENITNYSEEMGYICNSTVFLFLGKASW